MHYSGQEDNSGYYQVKSFDLIMHLSNSARPMYTQKQDIIEYLCTVSIKPNEFPHLARRIGNSLWGEVSDKAFLSVSLAFLYPTGTGNYTDTYWPGCMNCCQFSLELCIFHLLLVCLFISVSTHSIKRTFLDSILTKFYKLMVAATTISLPNNSCCY